MDLSRFTLIVGLVCYTQIESESLDPGRSFIMDCWNNSLLECKGLPALLRSIQQSLLPEEFEKVNEVMKKKLQIDLNNSHSAESLRGVLRPSRFIKVLTEACFPFFKKP